MEEKIGLKLGSDVALRVDWVVFAEKISKSITEGFKVFCGDVKGGADTGIALAGAAKSIKQDIPVGTSALELILLCFAWSFDNLRANGHLQEESARTAARDAISKLKRQAEAGKLTIPYDFFEQPSQAEVYRLLRDVFIRNRQSYRLSARKDEADIRSRFDSAFRSAIWALWADRTPAFEELARTLNTPAAETADFERQWRAYRESLFHEFHVAPVFGQEEANVSLGQLYVPLRCIWREVDDGQAPTSRYGEELISNRKQVLHIRSLDAELDAWLDNNDAADWLRLIGGGPGSGKSTCAKAFAARIAQRADLRPIFVPLQRIKGENQLRENINKYFRDRSGCPFQAGPLERKNVENGSRLVLIFDGLDEIACPGETADGIARDMVDWIRDLYNELKGETNEQHRILITGRMPSFQAARRRVNGNGREALEVVDLLPISRDGTEGDKALIGADHRTLWWDHFSRALGREAELPLGLTDKRLSGLTAEPLLCYLLALSGYLEEKFEEAAQNRNKVYERLLADVWERTSASNGRTSSRCMWPNSGALVW